MKRKII